MHLIRELAACTQQAQPFVPCICEWDGSCVTSGLSLQSLSHCFTRFFAPSAFRRTCVTQLLGCGAGQNTQLGLGCAERTQHHVRQHTPKPFAFIWQRLNHLPF